MRKVTKKTIQIDKDAIRSLDVSHLQDISLNANDWLSAGQSEYRLYAWLSTQFDITKLSATTFKNKVRRKFKEITSSSKFRTSVKTTASIGIMSLSLCLMLIPMMESKKRR